MKFPSISEYFERQSVGLRFGAIGLAFLLWIFVVSENRFTLVIDVPLEFRNLSAKKALKQEVPESAQVRFSGNGRSLFKAWLLKQFYPDFKLVLDLERISEEYDFVLNEYFALYPQKVVIPNALDIQYIEVLSPREVHIVLDEYLVKKVPVTSEIIIETLPGYLQVGSVTFTPDSVEIAGPKETIQMIQSVTTDRDTITQAQYRVRRQLGLNAPSKIVELSQNTVVYEVDVQAISERIITEVPVQVLNIPEELRVFVNPRTVSLTVVGGLHRIESLNPENINITIDFMEQWNSKTQFYEPRVTVPADIQWQDLSPRNLELVVTKEVH